MNIAVSATSVQDLWQEGLVLGIYSDERPPRGYAGLVDLRLSGVISRAIARERITGRPEEATLLAPDRSARIPPKILLLGLGDQSRTTGDVLYRFGRRSVAVMKAAGCHDCAVAVPGLGRSCLPAADAARSFLAGLLDAFGASDGRSPRPMSIHIVERPGYIDDVQAVVAAVLADGRSPTGTTPDGNAGMTGTESLPEAQRNGSR